jgi:hypothetical protein
MVSNKRKNESETIKNNQGETMTEKQEMFNELNNLGFDVFEIDEFMETSFNSFDNVDENLNLFKQMYESDDK